MTDDREKLAQRLEHLNPWKEMDWPERCREAAALLRLPAAPEREELAEQLDKLNQGAQKGARDPVAMINRGWFEALSECLTKAAAIVRLPAAADESGAGAKARTSGTEVQSLAGSLNREFESPDRSQPIPAAAGAREMQKRIKHRLDYRLNDHLGEMRPDYDDSIVGFNEAWDIVRSFFADLEKETAP